MKQTSLQNATSRIGVAKASSRMLTTAFLVASPMLTGSLKAQKPQPTRLPPVQRTPSKSSLPPSPFGQMVPAQAVGHRSVSQTNRPWLRSSTSKASFDKAFGLIEQAYREYRAQAWVSAEESAWHAISLSAQGIDQRLGEDAELSNRSLSSLNKLEIAKTAMTEARDFAGVFGAVDTESLRRIVLSHQTGLLKHRDLSRLSAADVTACYLDHARIQLADIAAKSVEAAEAMDLLAAVYISRDEQSRLPNETALCFRRAALQGQPQNSDLAAQLGHQLADLGLLDESEWALRHSLEIDRRPETAQALAKVLRRTGQTEQANELLASMGSEITSADQRAPVRKTQITRLTPEQFAAISAPVQTPSRSGSGTQLARPVFRNEQVSARLAGAKQNVTTTVPQLPQGEPGVETKPPGKFASLMQRFKLFPKKTK